MYIFDCLYGKIEFDEKTYKCMLSPEVQRLREVRLGNINSLCLTGSANNNRYEHSIGTAYLAKINAEANKSTFPQKYKKLFVLASLFHDLGNGPFGHSYEYIVQKQGFDPEKSLAKVIFGEMEGPHGKGSTCEPFYLGLPNELSSILNKDEVNAIDKIVRGSNPYCSKILCSTIDIDNIDNVYRMAYHMGLPINKEAPIQLAKGLVCKNKTIYYKDTAVPYLYDWYETRSRLYELLLYNPQDFSAKCMLSEIMENVLFLDKERIKWQFTDGELVEAIMKMKEEYWNEEALFLLSYDEGLQEADFSNEDNLRHTLSKLNIPISNKAKITITKNKNNLDFTYYNTDYTFDGKSLFKKGKEVVLAPAQLMSRLMRGDLYGCIGIFVSCNIDKYELFSDYKKKKRLEMQCNYYVEKELGQSNYIICFHGIIDKNKTNRQLEICLESGETFQIGKNTSNLIIGAFLKNKKYGLTKGEIPGQKRKQLCSYISSFLEGQGIANTEHLLYSEVNGFEKRDKK